MASTPEQTISLVIDTAGRSPLAVALDIVRELSQMFDAVIELVDLDERGQGQIQLRVSRV